MKNKINVFINHIYPRRLYVVVTDCASVINNIFTNVEDDGKEISKEDLSNNQAITFRCKCKTDGYYGVCVVFRKKEYMTIKNMGHESLHVATSIHKDLGMSMGFNLGEDETCAYIVGWAIDCMNQVKTNKFK